MRHSHTLVYLLIFAFMLMSSSPGLSSKVIPEKKRRAESPVVKVKMAGIKISAEQASKFAALMEEGKRLLQEWMDYRGAIQKFSEAKALAQTTPEKSDVYYYLSLAYFASLEQRGDKEFNETVKALIEVDYYRLPDENECSPQYISMYNDLKRDYGLLKILSNPPGADVFFDDSRASAGKTPMSIGRREGDIKVRVKKGGKQKKDTLTVMAGKSTTSPVYVLTGGSKLIYFIIGGAALAAGGGALLLMGGGGDDNTGPVITNGSLKVESSPDKAKIYFGREGASITDSGHETPYTFTDQVPGNYTVRLERENYQSYQETKAVTAGETAAISASLVRDTIKVTKPAQGDQIKLTSNLKLEIEWEVNGSSSQVQSLNALRNFGRFNQMMGRRQLSQARANSSSASANLRRTNLGRSLAAKAVSQQASRLTAGPVLNRIPSRDAIRSLSPNPFRNMLSSLGDVSAASISKVKITLLWGKDFKSTHELVSDVDASTGKYSWDSTNYQKDNDLKAGQFKVEIQSSTDSNVTGDSGAFIIFEPALEFERKAVMKLSAYNLEDPYGIAVYKNNIYLSTTGTQSKDDTNFSGKHRIVKLSSDGKTKVKDVDLGRANPWQIAAYNNYLYVAEAGNSRVAKYDLDLKYTGDEWKAPADQGAIKPRGVTVDSSGYVYINDYRQKVQKYTPKKVFVRNMHTISENGIALNLAMDYKKNILYIAERGIDTVVSYLTSGAHNANWEVFPSGSDPVGIAVDSKRNVYVCTQAEGEQKVYVIGANGTLKGSFGFPGKGAGQFKHPIAIAIDESDSIYVLDPHPDVMDIEKWAIKN